MPLVNGKEVIIKSGQPEKIQTEINKIEDLKADLKSENEPKKGGELYVTDDGMGEIGFSLFDKQDEVGRERKIRYDYYKEMDQSEFIHRALEIVADDSTQMNPDGNAIKVYSDDENIKNALEELFIDKLDMNNELWSIVFETCKMGDNFYEVVVNDYNKPKNIIFLRYLEPDKVDRVEENGRLSYYTYKTSIRKEDEKEARKYGYETSEEVIYKLQPWQIIHFKLENKGFIPYGASLLYSGLQTFRRLNLLEDVMIVYRLSRAPERRVFYIDVGNLNKIEAKRFLEKVKNAYRTSAFIDENGNINKKARMLSITNDIFVPVREGQQGTRIETLQGGEALHNIDDMKYFRDKILRTMNIPPAYLGDESDRSRGSLSQLDIKFSRFIERIQSQMIKGLNKIAALELFFAGYKKEQLNNFFIELTPPSNIKEITEIDLMGQKMNLLASIQGLNIFSNQWMLKNILKLSDAEIADIELYRRLEAQNAPPGEEVPGSAAGAGITPTGIEAGAGMPQPEAGEAGVAPPEETPGTEAGAPGATTPPEAAPEEIVANTIIKNLGKEFIVENQRDFFKILKYINEANNKAQIQTIEEWNQLKEDLGEIFIKTETEPNTNNVRRQFIINEFGGLHFKNGNNSASIDIYESVENNAKAKNKGKKNINEYKVKTIVLD